MQMLPPEKIFCLIFAVVPVPAASRAPTVSAFTTGAARQVHNFG